MKTSKEMAKVTYDSKEMILNKILKDIYWVACQDGKYSVTFTGGIWEESTSPVRKYVVDSLSELGYRVSVEYNQGYISWYPETKQIF